MKATTRSTFYNQTNNEGELMPRVLLVGYDPATVDFTDPSGLNALMKSSEAT